MRRVVVVPDIQAPYHSTRAVASLARYIRATAPDMVICVGDEIDAPQVSRWSKGLRDEYAANLGKHRDSAVRVLEELQVQHLQRSNHGDRVQNYVERHAPGLLGLKELEPRSFLKLDELGIQLHTKPWEFHPGWFMMHGDEGGLSPLAGNTALGLARKIGASVVCGHTHRLGIMHETDSVNGKIQRVKTGFEVGTLMDMAKAEYVVKAAGAANWQLGFGILDLEGQYTQCTPVLMQPNGSFVADGRVWK